MHWHKHLVYILLLLIIIIISSSRNSLFILFTVFIHLKDLFQLIQQYQGLIMGLMFMHLSFHLLIILWCCEPSLLPQHTCSI